MKRASTSKNLRLPEYLEEKIQKIADVNGLSFSAVAILCLAGGITSIEDRFKGIHTPKKAA